MTPYPKRLIEVDLPIKKISEHARREKSIRHGHISTLHIWWARRPLAACRAVLCASLWPDPADPLCPEEFRKKAAEIMRNFWDPMGIGNMNFDDPLELRKALLDFIGDFADWDNSNKEEYIQVSRSLTSLGHRLLDGGSNEKPVVIDPFAGGGAIPFESLRIGAQVFASDLNPIPVLLNKVILEYIPKYGRELYKEVDYWGKWLIKESENTISDFYPNDSDGSVPIAFLWARVVKCEGPSCGAEIPLLSSTLLSKKGNNSVAVKIIPNTTNNSVEFDVNNGTKLADIDEGIVKRGSVTCPLCGFTTPVSSVKKQLKQVNGGSSSAQLFTVIVSKPGERGKTYRLPNSRDLDIIAKSAEKFKSIINEKDGDLSLIPWESLPIPPEGRGSTLGFGVQGYGMERWADIYTPRQLLTFATMIKIFHRLEEETKINYDPDFSTAIQTCLALAFSRSLNRNCTLTRWDITREGLNSVFLRQVLPMLWDFAETNYISNASGSLQNSISDVLKFLDYSTQINLEEGVALLNSATNNPLPDDLANCFFTDPPYYDAVPYSDLSDFFYVWLKRTIGKSHPTIFSTNLTPKDEECIMDELKGKDKKYFEISMAKSLAEARRVLTPSGIGVVVFANKTTSGWESQLQAMIDAGWVVTASWPIDTEMANRLRARNAAALASSVHLVCRPRENPDGSLRTDDIGEWRDVLQELPVRIHEWMPRLAEEGVVGADAIFACLGPALEIFSQYSRVEKPSGEEVTLKEYLEHVWGAVSKEALNMIFAGANTAGFEEDARLTSMWLWTLSTGPVSNGDSDEEASSSSSTGLFVLEYDTARKIAQGLGAHLDNLGGLVELKGDKARLLAVEERTPYLFGKSEVKVPKPKQKKKGKQMTFAEDSGELEEEAVPQDELNVLEAGKTTLDRLHQAMLLFAGGRSEALKRFLVEDGIGKDERFWRLAQAMSALYPSSTNEKRWVDGLLARKKGLGF